MEDCGSSPGLGAEARSGEARWESPDGGVSPGGREEEGKRSAKKRKKSVV